MTRALPPEQIQRQRASGLTAAASGETAARVAVIYNPRSHRNRAAPPPDMTGQTHVTTFEPAQRADLTGVLRDIHAQGFDTIVINGGDGTVRDVMTLGYPIYGENWPRLCALPRGKTNALNIDLRGPKDVTLADALRGLNGKPVKIRRPLMLRDLNQVDAAPLLGFVLGAGNFTSGTRAAQEAHRFGAFNDLAVGLTIGWVIAQTLFGTNRNPWRAGVRMNIRTCAEETPLPHSGFGDPDRRGLLFASSMDNFPLGAKPFAPRSEAGEPMIRLVAIDRPRRRIMGMLPLILAGYRPGWLLRAGLHQLETECIALDIDDEIIFDGEAFPAGRYSLTLGPKLEFIVP